jgi:CRP-like cAMP-binding protein
MRKVLYIFGLLTDADVEWMASTGARRRLHDGEIVIEEGKPVDSVILLLQGELLVGAKGSGQFARLGVGEIVGEMSFVDSALPSATVTAQGGCLALYVDKATLAQKLESDVAFGYRFYRALAVLLADRLREARRLPTARERGLGNEATVLDDELDVGILDAVSAAGQRFDRMLKILIGRP